MSVINLDKLQKYRRIQAQRTIALVALFVVLSNVTASLALAEDSSRRIPTIEWDTQLKKFQFDAEKFIGQRLTVKCPPAPADQSFAGLHGTDSYPSDSPICLAALHAGVITKEGGTVTVQLNPGEKEYQGSRRNGVETSDLPGTRRSITFVGGPNAKVTNQVHLSRLPKLAWDTKFTATGFAHRHLIGQRFSFRCPAAPSDLRSRIVYGTDSYDFSSKICRAAVHAGRLTKAGGIVTVQIDPGVPKLIGSIRNGIETKSKGGGDRSISFVENPVQ